MKDGLIERIKSRGYWRINFQPTAYPKDKLKLSECRSAIENSSVLLRGWDYPHVPKKNDENEGIEPCGDYYEGWVEWSHHKEFWRIYRSRQFLHYLALREDWYEASGWTAELAQQIKPGAVLNVVGSTVYQLVEIFEFLSRLTRAGFYQSDVTVTIQLENMQGRELRIDDPMRIPLLSSRKTGANFIKVEDEYSPDKLKGNSQENALRVTREIFDNFGWDNPPINTIKADQAKLLSGRA